MSHTPTLKDAASDLRRCIYASFSKDKFDDPNFKDFYNHAIKIVENMKVSKNVLNVIERSVNKSLDENKRREDLLMAAILLQNA